MNKLTKNDIYSFVDGYPTKYKEGFTSEEIKLLILRLKFDYEKFCKKLGINTGIIINGECLTYHSDIKRTLLCMLENREPNIFEWD